MSTPTPNNPTWDNSDVLQGIMGSRTAPIPSQPDLSADGLAPPELALGDPASFLGFQFASDPAVLPHRHAALFNQWLPYQPQSTSPAPLPFEYSHQHPRMAHDQEAWNPLQVTGVPQSSMLPIQPMGKAQLNELDHKYHAGHRSPPSENGSQQNGIHPSDSGYSSRSCATRSVTSFAVDSACSPYLAPGDVEHEDKASSFDLSCSYYGDGAFDPLNRVGSPSFLCHDLIKCDYPSCPWTGKCPSDKRKHEARHKKLFKCDEPNCSRKEGFGTINDLARHKKCVHKQDPERGPKVLYMCFGNNCPRRNKKWPRLDNFRQHLARMHHDEDAEELLKKSQSWYETCIKPQELATSFIKSSPEVDAAPVPKVFSEPSRITSNDDRSNDFCAQVVPGQMDQSSSDDNFEHAHISPNEHGFEPTPMQHAPMESDAMEMPALSSLQLDPRAHTPSPEAIPRSEKLDDVVAEAAINVINAMTKVINGNQRRHSQGNSEPSIGQDSHLTEQKRKMLQRILSAALDQLSGTQEDDHDSSKQNTEPDSEKKGWIQCEFCSKRTRLRCEMKKHKKRHERPYGCTFHKCTKTFGSKADWKRHENSQHYHLQSWRCTLNDPSHPGTSLPCARLFYRQEIYVQHLRKHHHVTEEDVRASICRNRIGRNGESQFWCGFCKGLIPVRNQGLAAWNERFNHIDVEHFRKGERIGDWLLPEGHLTKEHEREVLKKKGAGASSNNGDEESDDDDNDDEEEEEDDGDSSCQSDDDVGVLRDETLMELDSGIPGSLNARKRKYSDHQTVGNGHEDRSPRTEKRSKVTAFVPRPGYVPSEYIVQPTRHFNAAGEARDVAYWGSLGQQF